MEMNNYFSSADPADYGFDDAANDPFNTSFEQEYDVQPTNNQPYPIPQSPLSESPSAASYAPCPEPEPSIEAKVPAQSMSDAIQAELDRKFEEHMRQEIEPLRITAYDQLPPLIPVVKRNNKLMCSEGNISVVVGAAKSKKTFLCTAIVGSMLDVYKKQLFGIESNRCKVLWVDTEQSAAHIQKVLFRINLMGEMPPTAVMPRLTMLQLREKSPQDRLTALSYGIAVYQPKLVVVDGVSDLMVDTNCLKESEALVSQLLTLSSAANCHIICVLHANPNSDKARGHLGSTLMRKAETLMFVHKTGEMSVVEPQHCRNEEFERFAFKVEEAVVDPMYAEECAGLGIPVECDIKEEARKDDDCVVVLREEFGGIADKSLLVSKIRDKLQITANYARVKVFRAIERGLLTESNGTVSIAE